MQGSNDSPGIVIPFKVLLAVYAIVPILIAAVLVDTLFFGNWLQKTLPNTPDSFVWYGVLFGLPHIMASFFSFADREYLRFYKNKLLYQLPVLLLAIVLIFFYIPTLAILIYVVYTLYHVTSQQGGITLIFARGKSSLYDLWRWMIIILASFVYFAIYYSSLIPLLVRQENLLIITLLLCAIALVSIRIIFEIHTREGRWYFLITSFSFMLSPFFFIWGYTVFAVLSLRFVHDVTAFIFYTVHDSNRNREQKINILYRYLPTKHIPIIVFTPILAIAIALPISLYAGTVVALLLAFTHYYTEAFVWKRDTPHRKQMAFEPSHAISK